MTDANNTASTKAHRFSHEALRWMEMTIRLYDARKNGFGVSAEVWGEVRRRGWYYTKNDWPGLTEKGRKEIPNVLAEYRTALSTGGAPETAQRIRSVSSWNSGGGIELDLIELADGSVLAISDESAVLYRNMDDLTAGDAATPRPRIDL